jgi:hypothetical protein
MKNGLWGGLATIFVNTVLKTSSFCIEAQKPYPINNKKEN